MQIRNLYQPFELELLETNAYQAQRHKNTFFEMVFVLDGKGVQLINEHRLAYGPDKLFLVFPSDSHGFEISEPSRFFFIRFSNVFLQTQNRKWVEKLNFIFRNYNHRPGCILKNTTDKPLVRSLAEALLREQVNAHIHREEVMAQLICTVISIAARNIALELPLPAAGQAPPDLLHYIHTHIYEPGKLRVAALAAHFHLAPSYIGEYFKKQAGAGLQEYIGNYRLRMLEHRLLYTDMRIHEIAEELGFADESHLNRTFKKHHSLSPTSFRRQQRETSGVLKTS